jgi:hypothetical protein
MAGLYHTEDGRRLVFVEVVLLANFTLRIEGEKEQGQWSH